MSTVMMRENFVANLAAAMSRQGLTQAELSRKSGVHFVTVNRILRGTLEPSLSMCEKLAEAAKMPLKKIFAEPAKSA